MIFHENRLPADDSHEISYLIFFSKIGKEVANFVVCCSCEWCFKGLNIYWTIPSLLYLKNSSALLRDLLYNDSLFVRQLCEDKSLALRTRG